MSNNDISIDDLFNKRSAKRRTTTSTAQPETVTPQPETVTPEPHAAAPSSGGGVERSKGGRPRGSRTGAAPSYEDRITRAAFYIDRDILEQLDAKTAELGLNKSHVVREAITTWLHNH